MGRFSADGTSIGGRAVRILRDADAGTEARILVGYGNNCHSLVRTRRGESWDYIHAAQDFAERPSDPSGNGTPILFPFPNRIRDGRFPFGGKEVALPVNHPEGVIHGHVMDAPWRVEEASDEGAARIRVAIDSRDIAGPGAAWPFPYALAVTWSLQGPCLEMVFEVRNTGEADLPFGIGIHPYFRLPGPIDGWHLRVPVRARWDLVACLPTGEVTPIDPALPLADGLPIGERIFDDAYTGVVHVNGRAISSIEHAPSGRRLRLGADASFREIVVYTPPERQAVSIEPYTCVTDAFNLAPRGIDAGMRVLAPNGSFRASVWMCVE
ncbi:MAG: aldose 1-epimerase [Planctomycetes bacterium]|nr:aldose 1-epimerase [Planctomycetota bacterium]